MTSLKKYLFEYNNKDASELGEPRLRDVVQLVFMFVFPIYTFSIRSPRFEFVCFFNFLFIFCFFMDCIWRFNRNGTALCEKMWLNFR